MFQNLNKAIPQQNNATLYTLNPQLLIYLLIYLVLISLITFIIFGVDKYKAKKNQRRISEKQLLQLVALGGGLGALAGMEFFRHKTIKGPFLWKFWGIVAIWVVVLIISTMKGI